MLNKIVVTNPKGEALELELTNPDKSGFAVAKVEGLGPPKANINGQEMAATDGMFYTSARADSRQIIFTLEFRSRSRDSKYGYLSIEDCRHLCYQYFPLKKEITITVHTDTQILYTKGYVESNDPEIFSMQEYTTISVLCPDPYMYEYKSTETVLSRVVSKFEFPFSNESLTKPLIEFGEVLLEPRGSINYSGSVDTGVLIKIRARGICKNIILYNVDTRERMRINTDRIASITGNVFKKGDAIHISTVRGYRYCRLLRDGVYTNIIGALDRDADWFQISGGKNVFTYTADAGSGKITVSFSYQNAFMGV